MIDRRDFLKGSTAMAGMTVLPGAAVPVPPLEPDAWRRFEIRTRVVMQQPRGRGRAWIPLPSIAEDWIRPLDNHWRTDGAAAIIRPVGAKGGRALCVEWPVGTKSPAVEIRNRIMTRDRVLDLSARRAAPTLLSEAERRFYTRATALIPTDGIVKDTAVRVTAGAGNELEKARKIYEWVVANTYRDPKVRGCGAGNIAFMLETGNLGGKCADLNALFVGLARASGLPARDLYGIRIAPSRLGYKSLGAGSEIVTTAQHCRAEIYLAGFGWVPADPADVRKVALEEPPGNLAMDADKVAAARRVLFGAWEGNWIAYNDAHDVELPGATAPRLGFFMYPQAETASGRLDCLDADAFKYSIESREIAI